MVELNTLYPEDCRETMARIDDNSIDSIVTDPPYELGFMGKKWDSSGIAYNVELWKACFRILKPGGYLLAFGGTRTSHRMVCAIEDAGFEIRDSILWLYGSGFPKSVNMGIAIDKLQGNERKVVGVKKRGDVQKAKERGAGYLADEANRNNVKQFGYGTQILTKGNSKYEGWGTALKPAHEPICVARKPISESSVANNVLKHGTGAINIDACRTETYGKKWTEPKGGIFAPSEDNGATLEVNSQGRFPANIILDPFTADLLDEQAPDAGAAAPVKRGKPGKSKGIYGNFADKGDDGDSFYDDKGGASRFFYVAKSPADERNRGLYQFPKELNTDRKNDSTDLANRIHNKTKVFNTHPTVKPVKLIQYLCKLVTPPAGVIYDPFGGSGTTAMAAITEGFKWIMSENDPVHIDIANKRIYNHGGIFL